MPKKVQLSVVDQAFSDIANAAQYALKDNRYYENQSKQMKKIRRLLTRIDSYVAWASMH